MQPQTTQQPRRRSNIRPQGQQEPVKAPMSRESALRVRVVDAPARLNVGKLARLLARMAMRNSDSGLPSTAALHHHWVNPADDAAHAAPVAAGATAKETT
jgi:hypothetical protein